MGGVDAAEVETGLQLERTAWRAVELVAAVPGVAALALGGLYLSGAIQWGASLREADVVVRDALPMIPLEQMLGRGIDIAVRALGLLLAMSIGMVASLALIAVSARSSTQARRVLRRSPQLRSAAVIYVCSVLMAAFFLPPLIVLSVGMMAAIGFWFLYLAKNGKLPRRRLWPVMLYAACLFVVAFAGVAGNAIVNPSPRPTVTLKTKEGPTVRGVLVVNTGSEWYVGLDSGVITALPTAEISQASFESQDKPDSQSTASWVGAIF